MPKRWGSVLLALMLINSPLLSANIGTLKVSIKGVTAEQELNILNFLSIHQLHSKEVSSPERIRYLHSKASAEIRKALQPFGFYRPEITPELSRDKQNWLARYQIDPGPPLPIGALDIKLQGEALTDDTFGQLLRDSPLRPGTTLVHADYEMLKRQLVSLAAERGYYRAQLVQHRVEVDLSSYQARISLHFDSGPRFHMGELSFTGNPLSNDFLMRYVPFQPGEPLDSNALIELQRSLIDSDYFRRVEVRPVWEKAESTEVPIEVVVDAHKRTRYQAGVGYGTDTGARAKLGMTRRWVNSRGHQFSSQLLASEIRSGFAAEYSIPGLRPQRDRYAVQLSLSDEDSDAIDTRNHSLGVSWQHHRRQWKRRLALEWQQESFTFNEESRKTQFLIPRVAFSTLSTENRLNIREGYRLSAQLLGGSDLLLSDTDFIQFQVSGKAVHSLNPKLRLLGRIDTALTAVDDFDSLPATLRFFAGGDNSVRGYDYKSLGPVNAEGSVIGGTHLLVGSVELEYRIKEAWGIAAFIDSGNAFKGTDIRLRTGVGIGLRWISPLGPIRLDLAIPVNGTEDDYRLHFSLGPDL